jgi:ABC-type protease/lipase transport system fused ATPase/permease subunit
VAYRNDFTSPQPKPPASRRGVLDPRLVRISSFAVSSGALLLATVLSILAIWDRVLEQTAWRAIATLGVLVASALLFNVVNEFFGARLAELPPPRSPTLDRGELPHDPDPSPAPLNP